RPGAVCQSRRSIPPPENLGTLGRSLFTPSQVSVLSLPAQTLPVSLFAAASVRAPAPLAVRAGRFARWLALAMLLALLAACGTTKVQPGYYRVQSGDTLTQIARKQGTSVSNLVRWNNLSNSNSIEVGQMLRVEAPAGQASSSAPSKARGKPQG